MNPTLQRCALALAVMLSASAAWAGRVHPDLEDRLRGRPAAEKIRVIVEMREELAALHEQLARLARDLGLTKGRG